MCRLSLRNFEIPVPYSLVIELELVLASNLDQYESSPKQSDAN